MNDVMVLPSKMLSLPNEALASIFTFLNPIESVSCKAVCKGWSKSAGHGIIIVRTRPTNLHYLKKHLGYITLNGRVKARRRYMNDEDNQTLTHTKPERTRGHLPKPSASITTHDADAPDSNHLLVDVSTTFTTDRLKDIERSDALAFGHILSMRTGGFPSQYRGAIQVERTTKFVSLDLSSTSSKVEYCCRVQAGSIWDTLFSLPKKPRTLRSSLEELDLSGLQHLRELSVRGCSKLTTLRLPPSIVSLDVGSCSELRIINFPNEVDGTCLRSLDLNGCRGLQRFGASEQAIKNVIHLDVSNVNQNCLDGMLCNALKSTVSLEIFSCRYAATDNVIKALARSGSAASNLRLVDIAFSKEVTDESVELLARSATKLERINMRGCKKITTGCYNHIPIYLERRRQNREDDSSLLEGDETLVSRSGKKGDNLFYFCRGNQGKRKR